MKGKRLRVKVYPSFILYLVTFALLASPGACAGVLCALAVHELAHLLVGHALGERFSQVELTPFGGVITGSIGESTQKGWRGALIAAAGPLANGCMIALLASPIVRGVIGEEPARQAALQNAVMMGFNLLPALPLDGGRIAFSLGFYALGATKLIRLLTDLGVALGAALAALSLFGCARYGLLNLSALIVGAYLIVSALRSRAALLAENLYAVVHERSARPRSVYRVQLYRAPEDAPLCSLLSAIEGSEASGFLVATQAGERYLSENRVLTALLSDPLRPIGEIAGEMGRPAQ